MNKLLGVFILIPFMAQATCQLGEMCQQDVPLAQCGDGSQSYIKYIDRGSENLFVYVQGGGACFDAVTCGCRLKEKHCKGSNEGGDGALTSYLSRPPADSQTHPWSQERQSPIGSSNYFEIVYCTGDVFTGFGTADYGNGIIPRKVKHVGAKNFELSINMAKKLFPKVKKVVVVGSSAGGVGVTFNLHHIVRNFGETNLSVINDSGIPIFGKYLDSHKVESVVKKWHVMEAAPTEMAKGDSIDFEDVHQFNSERFSHVKYGMLAADQDAVFQMFFGLLGGDENSVKYSIERAATLMDSASSHRYFFDQGRWHTVTFLAKMGTPKNVLPQSHGVNVLDWIHFMLTDSPEWKSLSAD